MSFGNTVSKKGTGLVLGRADAMQSDCLWKAATVHVDVILRVFSTESKSNVSGVQAIDPCPSIFFSPSHAVSYLRIPILSPRLLTWNTL